MDEWPIEYVTCFYPCVREDALKSLERLRDTEKTEAETRDSALELKVQLRQPDQTMIQIHTSVFNLISGTYPFSLSSLFFTKAHEKGLWRQWRPSRCFNHRLTKDRARRYENISYDVGLIFLTGSVPKRVPPFVFREQEESEPAPAGENAGSPEASNTKPALPGNFFYFWH